MALKLSNICLQSTKFSTFALPPTASFQSPKFLMASTVRSVPKEIRNLKKTLMPDQEMQDPITHSMPREKFEIFNSLENWVENNILMHLEPVEKSWQPQDFLPNPASDGFIDEIKEIRERAKEIPDDYFVVLVGHMIAEEAVTTYQTMLNTTDATRDETGASLTSWAIWIRAWTAEENRHGDLLNKYLYLTGRLDTRQVEKTIQYLIALGMDPRTENSPYMGSVYSSFQERATFISYVNAARLAQQYGDTELAKIYGLLAADEKRHEIAYTKITEKLFEIDPDETIRAFANMMRKKITMPAHLMYDGRDESLFIHFSTVTERLKVYTAMDSIDIVEFFVDRWKVKELTGLSADGRKAQDFVCELPQKLRSMEVLVTAVAKKTPNVTFSWIFDRELKL